MTLNSTPEYLVVRVLFPEEIDRDYARNCRLFGPWAVQAVAPWRVDVVVPSFGAAISGHVGVLRSMISVKWGKMMVIHKFSRFAGTCPANMWSKRGSLRPLARRGPASPNNVCEKKKKRCACSARAAGTLLARQN